MYLKAVSYQCHEFPSETWISDRFEDLRFKTEEVTSYKEYREFINKDWPSGNHFVFHESFSLDADKEREKQVEGEADHPFFDDFNKLSVGVFNCENQEEFMFGGYKNHILAGCQVYVLNDQGDTIDKVDLT